MEKTDIEYLNISEKIKKKLYNNNLNTIEKLCTNYLENVNLKEINLIQEEIFKCHLNQLGIEEEKENESSEIINSPIIYNNIYSLSDKENYNINNISDYSKETFFSSSSFSSSFESSTDSDLIKKKKENIAKNISYNNRDIIYKKGNQYSQNENVHKEKLEISFLLYSNFMKKNLKNHKIYKTENSSLNNLLCDGIESSKIYFFYGKNSKINKIVLVNLLFDIISNSYKNSSVVYIYFSYINDITIIHNIIKEKIEKQKEDISLNDILCNFYIFRVQNINELISFLFHVKNNYLKNKNSKDNSKNQFNNLVSIGIFNFTEIIKNLNVVNSSSNFYLVRELKILSNILNISILIFDSAKNESVIIKNKTRRGGEQELEEYYKKDNELKKEQEQAMHKKRICSIHNNKEYNNNTEEISFSFDEEKDHRLDKKNNYNLDIKNNKYERENCNNIENNFNTESLSEYESFEGNTYEHDSDNTDNSMNISINDIITNNISNENKIKNKEKSVSLYNKKETFEKSLVPYAIYNTFDFIIEIEVVNKIKNKKIIRFTLLKSQINMKYFYSHSYIKNYILIDLI